MADYTVPDKESRADHEPSGPRWVKVFGIVLAVLVLLVVVLILFDGHGPGRHAAPSAALVGRVSPQGGLA